jgi:hypothetical protein
MARAPLLTALVLVATACADSITTADGEGVDDPLPTLPENDAELRCPATAADVYEYFVPIVGAVAMGPCGHAAYHDDQGNGWLIAPDASRTEFEYEANSIEYAPTGDLIAWAPTLDGGVRLRDLLGGSERELVESGTVDEFGFVPSFSEPDRSAWLWTCEQGVLERHDLLGSTVVAESVACGSVAGSSGSPRLVYADQDGRVWLADLDGGVQIGGDDLEFVGSDSSSKRDDTLWIDHDGELLVHVAIEWQGDDDIDSEWPVELWARALDRRGQTVFETTDGGFAWQQASRRGAPVFVFHDGELWRFDAGASSSVASGLSRAELAASGELFFATETDELFVAEHSADAPLGSLGQLDVPVELRASRNGTVVAIEHQSDICIVDAQGECEQILLALRRWTRDSGLDDHVLYSTSPWELLATLDDGSMLVIGAPVEVDGPTYDGEQPQPRVMLLSSQGEIEADHPAHHGAQSVRQTFVLAADRLLFESRNEWDSTSLTIAGDDSFPFLGVGNQTIVPMQVWVDARGSRFAYASEHVDTSALNYGTL